MTRTEYLKKMLELGNRAGAYSIDEARSAIECLESMHVELEKAQEPEPKTSQKEKK